MWKEGETQEFAAGPLKLANKWLDERLEEGRQAHKAGSFPFSPDELLKLRVHSATFALTSIDVGKGALCVRIHSLYRGRYPGRDLGPAHADISQGDVGQAF